jgi:hypothetical protein
LNTLFHTFYRLLNKFVPCDITQVLLLEIEACQQPSNDVSAYDFRFLSAEEVRQLSVCSDSDMKSLLAEMVEHREAQCFAALDLEQLAAYSWFATGQVAAVHNSGGGPFSGIGLNMPENMVYLFNAFVLPRYRGKSLNNWVFQKAGEEFSRDGKKWIVTTTEWTNKAFQKSASRGGFVQRGHALEWILAGKHFFYLPHLNIHGLNFYEGTD